MEKIMLDTKNIDEVVGKIKNFFSNYHFSTENGTIDDSKKQIVFTNTEDVIRKNMQVTDITRILRGFICIKSKKQINYITTNSFIVFDKDNLYTYNANKVGSKFTLSDKKSRSV